MQNIKLLITDHFKFIVLVFLICFWGFSICQILGKTQRHIDDQFEIISHEVTLAAKK